MTAACSVTGPAAPPGADALDSERHPDAVALELLGAKVVGRAREVAADAVLRQVDFNPRDGRQSFRFTDGAAPEVISVTVPSAASSPDQWQIHVGISPLGGHPRPGLLLRALRIGPASVTEAATEYWQGCGIRGLNLIGEGADLVWYVFCNLPQGVVSGTVDARTGVFTPSLAPPARVPLIATPDSSGG